MKKVLLYYPKKSQRNKERHMIPFSILFLVEPLKKAGYQPILVDGAFDNVEPLLKKHEFICVGISSLTGHQIEDGLRVSRLVRKYQKNAKIVWGGWHPSILPEQTVRHDLVDIVCIGQGEHSFPELIHCIDEKKSFSHIPGVCYIKEDGTLHKNEPEKFFNPCIFPRFDYDELINLDNYVYMRQFGEHEKVRRTLTYMCSFGCPYNCGFCSIKEFKHGWYGLQIDTILEELEYFYKKYDVTSFVFDEANFFVNKKWVKSFCNRLIDRDLDITWCAKTRVDFICNTSDDLLQLMHKAGCRRVSVGVESGSNRELKLMNKGITQEMSKIAIKRLVDHGFTTGVPFLLGYPGSSFEDLCQSVKLMKWILSTCPSANIAMNKYTPYPGTDAYKKSLELGFNPPSCLEEWTTFDWHADLNRVWLTKSYKKALDKIDDLDNLNYRMKLSYKIGNKYSIDRLMSAYRLLLNWKIKNFTIRNLEENHLEEIVRKDSQIKNEKQITLSKTGSFKFPGIRPGDILKIDEYNHDLVLHKINESNQIISVQSDGTIQIPQLNPGEKYSIENVDQERIIVHKNL